MECVIYDSCSRLLHTSKWLWCRHTRCHCQGLQTPCLLWAISLGATIDDNDFFTSITIIGSCTMIGLAVIITEISLFRVYICRCDTVHAGDGRSPSRKVKGHDSRRSQERTGKLMSILAVVHRVLHLCSMWLECSVNVRPLNCYLLIVIV